MSCNVYANLKEDYEVQHLRPSPLSPFTTHGDVNLIIDCVDV